jgi:hypothetical protein
MDVLSIAEIAMRHSAEQYKLLMRKIRTQLQVAFFFYGEKLAVGGFLPDLGKYISKKKKEGVIQCSS